MRFKVKNVSAVRQRQVAIVVRRVIIRPLKEGIEESRIQTFPARQSIAPGAEKFEAEWRVALRVGEGSWRKKTWESATAPEA